MDKAGRHCRHRRQRRREAPTTAGAAETAACRAREPFSTCQHPRRHPPSLPSPVCIKSHFTQPKKKAIYSARTDLHSQRKPIYAYDLTFLCPWFSLLFYRYKIVFETVSWSCEMLNLSLINMDFLLRNLFSGLTLLWLANYCAIELFCESWFRCIRNSEIIEIRLSL